MFNIDYMNLKDTINQIIAEHRLSPEKIAKKINASKGTVYNWIDSDKEVKCDADKAGMIAEKFGYDFKRRNDGYWDFVRKNKSDAPLPIEDQQLLRAVIQLGHSEGIRENDELLKFIDRLGKLYKNIKDFSEDFLK